jgi:hypothetical protein
MIVLRGSSDAGLLRLEKSLALGTCVGECLKVTHMSESGPTLVKEGLSEHKRTRRSTSGCAAAFVVRGRRVGRQSAEGCWDCRLHYRPAISVLQTRETSELEIELEGRHLINYVFWKGIVGWHSAHSWRRLPLALLYFLIWPPSWLGYPR